MGVSAQAPDPVSHPKASCPSSALSFHPAPRMRTYIPVSVCESGRGNALFRPSTERYWRLSLAPLGARAFKSGPLSG